MLVQMVKGSLRLGESVHGCVIRKGLLQSLEVVEGLEVIVTCLDQGAL